MPPADRVRLAEAVRLGDALRERLWPGWGATPVPVLLVTDSAEYLVGHPRPTADFRPLRPPLQEKLWEGHDATRSR